MSSPVQYMDKGLTVGVNLLWCRPGRVGGAEEYLVRQLQGIRATAPEIKLRMAVPPGFAAVHPELVDQSEAATGTGLTSGLAGRLVEEVRWLPSLFAGVDVVHHANGTMPPRSPRPVVLTVHDLQYREYPQYFSPIRLNYLRWRIPGSVRRADLIAVPSEFVKGTVIEAFGVEPADVRVVPNGFEAPDHHEWSETELRARFRLGDRPVLVYPAATFPHKRHDFLLDLISGDLAARDVVLVLLGGAGRAEKSIARAVEARNLSDRVVRTGRVSSHDRDGLVALATALVFPSEYEGFGAPVIEAMALGTPVICSDRAALPEVAGGAALVVPLELEAWSAAVNEASTRREELIELGKRRAAHYTIEASGAALAAVYRDAAVGSSSPWR